MVEKITPPRTVLNDFLDELNAGVFVEKCERAISEVAASVCDYEKKGTVKIELTFKRASDAQVGIAHKLVYEKPTRNGTSREENTTSTNMHVGRGGKVSLIPANSDLHGGEQHNMFDIHGNKNKD